MNTIDVLLIDQTEVTTVGLMQTLCELNFNLRFQEVTSAPDVINYLKGTPSSIVFLNINSRKLNGYFIATTLLKEKKHIKLMLLTSSFAHPLLPRLIRLGAKGVLTFDSTRKEFQDAFRSIVAGDDYLFGTEHFVKDKSLSFSPVEFKLIHLLGEGKTSKEISAELHHTSKTIETYRSRLLKKTGVRNTSQLLSYFYKHEIQ